MRLKSSAFQPGGDIPPKYTCDGADVSPPLSWEQAPDETESYALICDDPDAPGGIWVHWVIYNIPHGLKSLPENVSKKENTEFGIQGRNDFGRIGYGGPCPPRGKHRYYFKVYALDIQLKLGAGASKSDLLEAMQGHVLDEAHMMGFYSR